MCARETVEKERELRVGGAAAVRYCRCVSLHNARLSREREIESERKGDVCAQRAPIVDKALNYRR